MLLAQEDGAHQHALPGPGLQRHPRQAAQHEGNQKNKNLLVFFCLK